MRFDASQIPDYASLVERLSLVSKPRVTVWSHWLAQYEQPPLPPVLASLPKLNAIEEVFRAYVDQDTFYVRKRSYLGHLKDAQLLGHILSYLRPLREFLGTDGQLPLMLVYPSCVLDTRLVSLLIPYKGNGPEKYLGQVSIETEALSELSIYDFESLQAWLSNHPEGPLKSIYIDNERADVFPLNYATEVLRTIATAAHLSARDASPKSLTHKGLSAAAWKQRGQLENLRYVADLDQLSDDERAAAEDWMRLHLEYQVEKSVDSKTWYICASPLGDHALILFVRAS